MKFWMYCKKFTINIRKHLHDKNSLKLYTDKRQLIENKLCGAKKSVLNGSIIPRPNSTVGSNNNIKRVDAGSVGLLSAKIETGKSRERNMVFIEQN